MNRQIAVADYKYVVLDDPLPSSHVTRRMRIANFVIKMAKFASLSSITLQRMKLEA